MHWIIQDSGGKHYNWTALYSAVISTGGSAEYCQLEKIKEYKSSAQPSIIFGGEDFLTAALDNKNLYCVIFHDNDFFRVDNYIKIWGNDYLNYDTFFYNPKGTYTRKEGDFFVRPLLDTKCFDGGIYHVVDGKAFRFEQCVHCIENTTCMCFSEVKSVNTEWRVVIVLDKIVSVCQYAVNGVTCVDETNIPNEVFRFAEKIIKKARSFSPRAWVLDVAFTNIGYKVIEANLFNASNLYNCDREAIVRSIEDILPIIGTQ